MPLTRFYPTVNTSLKPFCYVPNGWDTGWRTGLANRGSTPAAMLAIGDSMTIGSGADLSNLVTQPYFWLLRSSLVSSYGLNSDVWTPGNDGFITAGIITLTGSWGGGFNMHPDSFPTLTTASLTWAPPAAFTAFDIIHIPFTNGSTFTYAVDGGATNTVNVTTNGGYPTRTSVTGLSNATHSVVLANWSVNTPTQIQALISYPSGSATSGISFFNCSRTGIGSNNWRGCSGWTGAISAGTPTGFGLPYRADLVLINMGVNELLGPGGATLDPDNYYYCWRRLIQAVRRGTPNCSIMFVSACVPDANFSDAGDWSSSGANSQFWPLYIRQQYNLATEFNCALVNFEVKWTETPLGLGFLQTTNVHPTVVGHTDMANTILPLIQ